MSAHLDKLTAKLASPSGTLGIGLLVAAVLATLPSPATDPLRGAMASLLKPGQTAALAVRRQGELATTWTSSHFQTAARLAEAERELEHLRRDHGRLTAELAAARFEPAEAADDQTERLLCARGVPARVLGSQARAFLARRQMLDVGGAAGIQPDALVVSSPVVIDRGADADVRPDQLVLAGGRVWGKIAQLGSHTSTVRTATEAGYRDLVRLAGRRGPQGVLEGTGDSLARIRQVPVTEPVSLGDPVYTSATEGVLSPPPLYGHVVRLQRPVGAAHWEIWMQPAVTDGGPQRVAVVRLELNPRRLTTRGPIARQ